jgi:peroxiredoxin (alkyl hydroperoxide reductase subunit C)
MSLLVTNKAPDFKAAAVLPNGKIQDDFTLSQFKGKYVVLFFYPLDFTFVCPTEILAFNDKLAEFEKRNVQVIGVSVDSHFSHYAWRETDVKKGGIGKIGYPLVSDLTKKIASDYQVLLDDGIALRGLFLIDKDQVVRHQVINDLPLGRSIVETLRMVDALQTFEKFGEVCPADFKSGDKTMKADQTGLEKYMQETRS